MILYYVHDPMCSWCWGFKPVLKQLTRKLPDTIQLKYILGGLAKDTDQIMPEAMQDAIQSTWKQIQKTIPNTEFNYDFWKKCKPRRSTYLSCRAVIAAEQQDKNIGIRMIEEIQYAYYLNAENPSDIDVLINIADKIGLDLNRFKQDILSTSVDKELHNQIAFSRSIGADSFPSLYLQKNSSTYPIVLDYNNADIILEHINSFI